MKKVLEAEGLRLIIYSVVAELNPEVDFEAFRTLTESWRYEDCLSRRSG